MNDPHKFGTQFGQKRSTDGTFTPIHYVSVVVSCRPVPRVSHTEPSRSCLHLQWNLVRPLSLTEELRLCQNIEHYQLSI
jgi:hypothetical protein